YVRTTDRRQIEELLAPFGPGAQRDLLTKLRVLFAFGCDRGLLRVNVALNCPMPSPGRGFWTWTEEEIQMFERRWPMGTPQRLGFCLHLYLGQRGCDLVRLKWGDIQGGRIRVLQSKTKTELSLPIHPELAKALSLSLSRDRDQPLLRCYEGPGPRGR